MKHFMKWRFSTSVFLKFHLNIYITYTKSFYKLHSSFSIFTVLKKLLSILLYDKKYSGTIPNYVKHINHVKVVHTKKKTIMTINSFTEVVTQSNPTERCPKKYAATSYKLHKEIENKDMCALAGNNKK